MARFLDQREVLAAEAVRRMADIGAALPGAVTIFQQVRKEVGSPLLCKIEIEANFE